LNVVLDIKFVFTDVQMQGSLDGFNWSQPSESIGPLKNRSDLGVARDQQNDLSAGSPFLLRPYSALQIAGALGEMIGEF
jgi:hypothetical protein